MEMKMDYTIRRITSFQELKSQEYKNFLKEEMPKVSKMFGDKFNFGKAQLRFMCERGLFLFCHRGKEVTGLLIAFKSTSAFDVNVKILSQQLLYVKPDSGRTAYHLFNKFIDIGRKEANHIITMLTSQTNIKSSTLERLGFKEMETLYRLEVDHGRK